MRRNTKPWFGPAPIGWNPCWPRTWQGYALTMALVLGICLLGLEPDRFRRAIALALLIAAYCAIVCLTWSKDPD